MSRPGRPRQEVRCSTLRVATGLILAEISLSRQSIFMSRESLVKTKSFYVATELAKVKRIYVATEYFCVTTEFGLE